MEPITRRVFWLSAKDVLIPPRPVDEGVDPFQGEESGGIDDSMDQTEELFRTLFSKSKSKNVTFAEPVAAPFAESVATMAKSKDSTEPPPEPGMMDTRFVTGSAGLFADVAAPEEKLTRRQTTTEAKRVTAKDLMTPSSALDDNEDCAHERPFWTRLVTHAPPQPFQPKQSFTEATVRQREAASFFLKNDST
mmetsp:Transcript_7487/g.24711  ORF Transcript_7487/g.24711 Transcript_7487/m.24711 type:complete len:192 (-) Transcript_7487:106-681(-)